jgi:hypothetical protein
MASANAASAMIVFSGFHLGKKNLTPGTSLTMT